MRLSGWWSLVTGIDEESGQMNGGDREGIRGANGGGDLRENNALYSSLEATEGFCFSRWNSIDLIPRMLHISE